MGKDEFFFDLPRPKENEGRKTLFTINSPMVNKLSFIKKAIKDTPAKFPQGELYEVILANSDNTYNLAKYSAFTYNYAPGGADHSTNVGGDLYQPDRVGTRIGPTLDNVVSILPGRSNSLEPGNMVEVCFYDRNRQRPYIKRMMKRGFFTYSPDTPTSLPFWWSQLAGNIMLSRHAESPIIGQFGINDQWIGSTLFSATPFGLALTKDISYAVTAQGLRNEADTLWEKVRLSLVLPLAFTPIEFETTVTTSPSFWTGEIFTNSDASLVILIDTFSLQLWRLRKGSFSQITITDMASFYPSANPELLGASISQLGYFVIPQFSGGGIITYGQTFANSNGVPFKTYGTGTPTGSQKIHGWKLDVESNTIPTQSWEIDLGANLPPDVVLFPNTGTPLPYSSDGKSLAAWISCRHVIPNNSNENKALLMGYPHFFDDSSGYNKSIGRTIEALVASIDTSVGRVDWTYQILANAEAPVVDGGILDPLTNWFQSKIPSAFPGDGVSISNTFTGRYVQNSMINQPFGVSSIVGYNIAKIYQPMINFSGSDHPQAFPYPQYDFFNKTGFQILPKETANDVSPRTIGDAGALNNMAVFLEYGKGENSSFTQRPGLVKDTDGNIYLAYLKPIGILYQGRSTYWTSAGTDPTTIGITNNVWTNLLLSGATVANPDPPPVIATSGHLPDLAHCYQRYMIKISATGAKLAERDLTQLYNASWNELEVALGWDSEISNNVVGGDSTAQFPLADNVWLMSPCGRVLFVILDYHDLGPNFFPSCKLQIFSAADLTLLHTVELRDSEDTISDDIFSVGDGFQNFTGDGITAEFGLSHVPTTVLAVNVDGIPVSYTIGGIDLDVLILSSPAAMGTTISIDYKFRDTNTIAFRADEHEYAVQASSVEIRTGSVGLTQEWAALFYKQDHRTDYPATGIAQKMLLLQMQDDTTTVPHIYFQDFDDANLNNLAVGSSSRWDIVWDTDRDPAAWKMRQKV